jgi:hypothetical protein
MPLSTVLGAQSVVKPGVCTTATRPASPFTGQLIYDTTVSQTLAWNGSAWTVQSGGLVYLGGTTGSASASINVDNVFSATYTNYLVQISEFTASVEDFWAIRLRASGSTITASNYSQAGQLNANTSDTIFIRRTTNTNLWYGDLVTTLSTNPQLINLWITNPFAATATRGHAQSAGCTNADFRLGNYGFNYNATTSVDGIALVPYTSGTLTGTIRVYGIVNS